MARLRWGGGALTIDPREGRPGAASRYWRGGWPPSRRTVVLGTGHNNPNRGEEPGGEGEEKRRKQIV
jgi:hypothetical protein